MFIGSRERGPMKPEITILSENDDGLIELEAGFGADDMSNVFKMASRSLAYRYSIDSISDEDIPGLLRDKLGADELQAIYQEMIPPLLIPYAIDTLDFQTFMGWDLIEASDLQTSTPATIRFSTHRKPEFELSSYDPVVLQLPRIVVSEDLINGFIAEIADDMAQFRTVSEHRKAELGDNVVFAMKTFEDMNPVLGLTSLNQSLTIGEGWLSKEFDENLQGMRVGDSKTFDFEALTGESKDENDKKVLTTQVTLKEIREKTDVEIDDDWVRREVEGANSLEELRAMIEERIVAESGGASSDELLAAAAQQLAGRLLMKISDELYTFTVNEKLAQMDMEAQSRKMSLPEYLEMRGQSLEELGEQLMELSKIEIEQGFALDAYFDHFGLSVDDVDINETIGRLNGTSRADAIETLRKQYETAGRMYVVCEAARRLKANKHAVQNAVIEYVDAV